MSYSFHMGDSLGNSMFDMVPIFMVIIFIIVIGGYDKWFYNKITDISKNEFII
ncbi:hypothetical protein [Gracilibacillus massiliensis]|uniref:hypothetical protein n=1 Tax=Gracilibacillus massiliensis TaxID=1564956 RepID=UPI000AA5A605|nr:hypothetical protein [Gracilibacillus massiliensis]